jgi:hypothetical protein
MKNVDGVSIFDEIIRHMQCFESEHDLIMNDIHLSGCWFFSEQVRYMVEAENQSGLVL